MLTGLLEGDEVMTMNLKKISTFTINEIVTTLKAESGNI